MQQVKQDIADKALVKAISMLALQEESMRIANLTRQCSIIIERESLDTVTSWKYWITLHAPPEIFNEIDPLKKSIIEKVFTLLFTKENVTNLEVKIEESNLLGTQPIILTNSATLLAQQIDFIARLKTSASNLLRCDEVGFHSELISISTESTIKLRDFCWEMSDKYKHSSQKTKEIFTSTMKGKLGEEALVNLLGDLITEVDYEVKQGGDGRVDFMLSTNKDIKLQVKARNCSVSHASWYFDLQEIETNDFLICFLIQEEVDVSQPEYHIISAGFLPTELIDRTKTVTSKEKKKVAIKIDDLLCMGGLKSCLQLIDTPKENQKKPNSIINLDSIWEEVLSNIPTGFKPPYKAKGKLLAFDGSSATIGIKPPLTIRMIERQTSMLKAAFESTFKEGIELNFQKLIDPLEAPEFVKLDDIWEKIIAVIEPRSTQILLRLQVTLLSFDGKSAEVGVLYAPLLKIASSRITNIKTAFEKVYEGEVNVTIKVIDFTE